VAHAGLLRPRDPDTVYAGLASYPDEGLPGLLAHQHGGNRRGLFSHDQERKQQLQERLHRGPGGDARPQAAATPPGPPPSRWTWDTIRASFDWLADDTPSGVWRLPDRLGLRLRSARVQPFSPGPAYADKLIDLEMALGEARRAPWSPSSRTRWASAAGPPRPPEGVGAPPVADRRRANHGLWRLIGGLNARTGQVNYLDTPDWRKDAPGRPRRGDRLAAGAGRSHRVLLAIPD
jgi:hypothetical protein